MIPGLVVGAAIGLLLGAGVLAVWGTVGFLVAAGHYLLDRPDSEPATNPDCQLCVDMQALWDGMANWERVCALPNFMLVATWCSIRGCGGLNLLFE